MPDPSLPTSGEEWVLFDRRVLFIDELQEMIQEMGGVPLDESVRSVLKALPACSSRVKREYQEQSAIEEEMIRYRAEVEQPAFAILRERQACRLSAARKEPVTFNCADADYYRELLDGIDARFPQPLAGAPAVNSFTLSISWPPVHHLRNYPAAAYIASCHANLLAIYFGTHRPGLPSAAGCYLVFNSWANSLAVIPPLPTGCVTTTSHCGIGAGVAVLSQDMEMDYLLAELFLRQDARSHLASNKATLFVWCSPGSGPLANRWIQKEVVLPLPADQDGICSFRANTVLQVSRTSLCWVDLQTGILVCRHISSSLVAGGADDDLDFHFIPLPEECAMKPDPLTWRQAEDYRSLCRVDRDTIVFVCMEGYSQGQPMSSAILRTWILHLNYTLTNNWMWVEGMTYPLGDLFNGSRLFMDGGKLQRLVPSCPIISCREPFDMHLSVAAFEYNHEHDQWEVAHFYEVGIDVCNHPIFSVFEFPSGCPVIPHPQIFGYEVRNYLDKMKDRYDLQMEFPESELVMQKELTNEGEPKSSTPWVVCDTVGLRGEEVADEDESHRPPSPLILCREALGLHRIISTPLERASPGSSKELAGLQCALEYPWVL